MPDVVIINESGIRHRFVEQLIQRLNGDGVSVELLTLDAPGPIHQWVESSGAAELTWFASQRFATALRHLSGYRGGTVLFAVGHRSGILSYIAQKTFGIPYAFSFVHQTNYFSLMMKDSSSGRRLRGRIHHQLEKYYLRSARWIQSVSLDSRLRLHDEQVDGSRIHDIPLGVDFAQLSPIAEPSKETPSPPVVPGRTPFVLSVGRLAPEKNHRLTLAAFKQFLEKHSDFHLVILGQGPQLEDLRLESSLLGIGERVHFPGFVSNPEDYFRQATIFTHASLSEAYASVQLEARLNNLPIVSSRCGVALDMAAIGDPLVHLMDSSLPEDWSDAWSRNLVSEPAAPWNRPDEVYSEHNLPNVLTALSHFLREDVNARRVR